MSSLAEAPDLVGFFSYSREDDEDSGGKLSKLRERIQAELRGQLGYGRTKLQSHTASCGKTKSSRLSLSRYFSFQSLRLLLSEATTANLNSTRFWREKKSLAAGTLYFRFFTSQFRR